MSPIKFLGSKETEPAITRGKHFILYGGTLTFNVIIYNQVQLKTEWMKQKLYWSLNEMTWIGKLCEYIYIYI